MLDDDVRIRPATPDEAEALSDIAWSSKGYWEYSSEMMEEFSDFLNVTVDFVETNPTYVVENEETEQILGFYSLEKLEDDTLWLRRLWVVPDYIGTGIGGEMYLHACELAETIGAEYLYAISDPGGAEFYTHMGAERLEDVKFKAGKLERLLPAFRIKL
ncbi:MAG: GNAT family N-acetyltransferase [Synergistaceae bacterium]